MFILWNLQHSPVNQAGLLIADVVGAGVLAMGYLGSKLFGAEGLGPRFYYGPFRSSSCPAGMDGCDSCHPSDAGGLLGMML